MRSDTGAAIPSAIPFPEPDESRWIRPAKDFASSRFSTLDQINTGNVSNLRVAFTFSTGVNKGHEAAPLVVDGTMPDSGVTDRDARDIVAYLYSLQ